MGLCVLYDFQKYCLNVNWLHIFRIKGFKFHELLLILFMEEFLCLLVLHFINNIPIVITLMLIFYIFIITCTYYTGLCSVTNLLLVQIPFNQHIK